MIIYIHTKLVASINTTVIFGVRYSKADTEPAV